MTLDTLLIPTDGSDPAEAAAQQAFALADQLDAAVHVISVADSSIATGVGYSGDSPSIRERLRETASTRATSLRDEAAERGLDVTAAIREGIPAKEIVDYADDNAIDAIVIGTSGRGGVTRAIVGSVADKIVRTSSVPVVTLTPDVAKAGVSTSEIDSILLPTDGSDPALEAIQQAFVLANQLEATVHLLSVLDDALVDSLSAVTEDDGNSSYSLHEKTEEHLKTLATNARERNLEALTATAAGSPAREIVDYADRNGIDMIAMGTHGRGGFERLVVGNVTDAVIRKSSVPVFTVRPNSTRTETSHDSPGTNV